MKIAFVVHDYHRAGGHSRYVVELAERFGREHEVHVFRLRNGKVTEGREYRERNEALKAVGLAG